MPFEPLQVVRNEGVKKETLLSFLCIYVLAHGRRFGVGIDLFTKMFHPIRVKKSTKTYDPITLVSCDFFVGDWSVQLPFIFSSRLAFTCRRLR